MEHLKDDLFGQASALLSLERPARPSTLAYYGHYYNTDIKRFLTLFPDANLYKPDKKKTRSISQSNLRNATKLRQDFPRHLVRQRSNTIIGPLPVLVRADEDGDSDGVDGDYEVVDVRTEIFRIKDQVSML